MYVYIYIYGETERERELVNTFCVCVHVCISECMRTCVCTYKKGIYIAHAGDFLRNLKFPCALPTLIL